VQWEQLYLEAVPEQLQDEVAAVDEVAEAVHLDDRVEVVDA
jgi:hypothetical protein